MNYVQEGRSSDHEEEQRLADCRGGDRSFHSIRLFGFDFYIWVELISFAFGFLFFEVAFLAGILLQCNIFRSLCTCKYYNKNFQRFLSVRVRNYHTLQISLLLLLLKDS